MLQESQCSVTCQELLRDLKTTVEGLLANQVANVWSVYGGLNRLHASLEKVFKHGYKENDSDASYLGFIQGLEWLQPESAKSYLCVDCEYRPHIPAQLKNNKSSIWLYRSIENHSLSQKLSWLLSDENHLNSTYKSYALLRQEKYAEALMTCLRAVERNQPGLLCEIDPCLFLNKIGAQEFHKIHRRCSSYPENHLRGVRNKNVNNFSAIKHELKEECDGKTKLVEFSHKKLCGKLKPWSSLPNLHTHNVAFPDKSKLFSQSKTTPSTPVHLRTTDSQSSKRKSYPKRNVSKKSDKCNHVIVNNVVEHTPFLSSSVESRGNDDLDVLSTSSSRETQVKSPIRRIMSFRSVPDYKFSAQAGQKDYKRHPKKSFIEDGGMKVQPVATGYFPRPKAGQSLTSFLTSSQFSVANAELDRENAHFCVSEALIAAFERMKCQRDQALADEQVEEESDPEIVDLKQRIRLRRKQKLMELQRRVWSTYYLKIDGVADTTTSASPYSTTPDSLTDSLSTEGVDDFEVENASNFADENGLSASMASLYSDADILKNPRSPPDGASDVLSAEGLALSLIGRFPDKDLPRASELEWVVTEEDAPQALLPLPKSWPINPDDAEEVPDTPLRGTKEWAPPRPQIIFTLHPTPDRKKLLEKQNYRCAGCSMKVAPKYASHFRYCDYLGRYFCTGCHSNQLALIPARVLQKWDFTRYPVSNFSYRLLEQMYADPLYRVFDLNKNIGKRSKNMMHCHKYRKGLYHLKDFIFQCRFAENVQETVLQQFPNVYADPEIYSMDDLVNIRSGELKKKLLYLVEICCRHTDECDLCRARGFICEICRDEKVIYPWQMRDVIRCTKCGSCFHTACWKPALQCVRCIRLESRHEVRTVDNVDYF